LIDANRSEILKSADVGASVGLFYPLRI